MGKPEMKEAEKIVNYTRHWRRLAWLEVAAKSLACSLIFSALSWFFTENMVATQLVFTISILGSGYLFYRKSPLTQLDAVYVARYLNQQYAALEYSSQLLLEKAEELSIPARLQRNLIAQKLNKEALRQPPVRLLNALFMLLISVLLSSLFVKFAGAFQVNDLSQAGVEEPVKHPADTSFTETLQQQIPSLTEGRLRVAPPSYTGQPAYFTTLASLRAPEGSRLTWQLNFSEKPEQVWLVLSNGDSLAFSTTAKGRHTVQLALTKTVLYRLVWQYAGDNIHATDFLRLEAVPDEAPHLQIVQPEQYSRAYQPVPVPFKAEVTDDYGLGEAYLQLTISQGSGENVSFREEKVWFEKDFSKEPERLQLSKTLDPRALGMVPGDELYFYLVAFDNRQPRPQQSRSETWFFHWLDTANQSAFEMGGMAMDLMPDYFRSQRQIIIDTEKLIKEQPALAEAEFEKRGNNLGIDQKLLRLRYGKFLGEEFESGYGEVGHMEGEKGHEEGEQESGEEDAMPGVVEHDHEVPTHEEPVSPAAGELLREFMHAHDTEEGATFYEESIKVKLKAALAEMWESELRLRTLRPKEALPYQYRALEIIKEVQQATRIYVERIGFEPPALKPAERRLTGELKEVASVSRAAGKEATDSLQAIKALIPLLQQFRQPEKENLRLAGQELAAIVQLQPQQAYLRALQSIGKLAEGKPLAPAAQQAVIKVLYSLLPDQEAEFRSRTRPRTAIETAFMRKIGGQDE